MTSPSGGQPVQSNGDERSAAPAPRNLGVAVAILSAIVTVAVGLYFHGVAESCEELGCLTLIFFFPGSMIAALIVASFVTAYEGRERAGCVAGLFWAAVGWLAGAILVVVGGMLRT